MIFKYITEMVENSQSATQRWMQWVCSLLVIDQILCNKHCLCANDTLELSRRGHGQRYGPGKALRAFYISWKDTMAKNKVTVYLRQGNRKSQKKCTFALLLLLHQLIFHQIIKTSRSCILIFILVCTLLNRAPYSWSHLTEILREMKVSSCKAQQRGS